MEGFTAGDFHDPSLGTYQEIESLFSNFIHWHSLASEHTNLTRWLQYLGRRDVGLWTWPVICGDVVLLQTWDL